jgi:hypothetical protein
MEYFMMGGPLFMSILTLLLIGVVYAALQRKAILREFGLAALAFGFLGQLIGLLGAFEAIEAAGGVSQSILAGGLKVSSITSIYGLMIYCTSLSIRIVSRWND